MQETPNASQNATEVLVVAATEREIRPLRDRLQSPGAVGTETGDNTVRGAIGGWNVVTCVSGPGRVNAALATWQHLESPVDLVVSFGCAGGFARAGAAVLDVILADDVVLADEGVETEEGFLDLHELGLRLDSPSESQPLYNVIETSLRELGLTDGLHKLENPPAIGRIATVSTGSGTDERARQLDERWNPLAEAMEGAGVALACRRRGCSFLELRGISNLVGNRDLTAWDIDTACRKAAAVLVQVLEWLAAH